MSQRSFIPAKPGIPEKRTEIEKRKEAFDALNRWVSQRNAWLTSVPGDVRVTLECLQESGLPDQLRERGYSLKQLPDGQRILHSAITESFLIEGSSIPVIRQHAGIVRTWRFEFRL